MLLQLRSFISILITLVCLLLSGCYFSPPSVNNPHDPFQHLNRDTARFNTKMDKTILKPVAEYYKRITPDSIRRHISNFFNNMDNVEDVANDILQGDGRWAMNDGWRFIINSTVGIGGLFDPASHIELEPHENDFALTLNRWHIYSAYLVVPFMGPRTVGGVIAWPADYYLNIARFYIPLRYSVALDLVYGLNARAQLLNVEKTASGLIIDKYIFYRSAYLQRREYLLQINQAGPMYPSEEDEEDYDDADESSNSNS